MIYSEQDFEDHIERELTRSGYQARPATDYNKALCALPKELIGFIRDTQPQELQNLENLYGADTESKLFARISAEIENRGLIDVLRQGIKDRGVRFQLAYFQPKSDLNPEHRKLYRENRFTIVRQLYFSQNNNQSVDIGLFINGLPVALLELKNSLTGQTHIDAVKQYCARDPAEPLFQFKRCLVFFAVGNEKVSMATRLAGRGTRFLPYNKDIENPVNPEGHKTAYLWEDILQPGSLLELIENFVHVRTEVEKVFDTAKGGIADKKSEVLVFPRYHQRRVVRALAQAVARDGAGHKYLIQHTTGSGKSLSIGWLSHLLTSLYQNPEDARRLFDSVIVVTDRKVLDKQIQNTIKQLEQTKGVVNPVNVNSKQLREYIEGGKHIIITTVQKFPMISKDIAALTGRRFAVVIDEVHSSQSGRSANELRRSLSKTSQPEDQAGVDAGEVPDMETMILREMEAHGTQPHISFFGFSGTPKGKTLEIFGRKGADGQFRAFDIYSMKQSIAEGFTLDVLSNYTTYERYFRLKQEMPNDPEVDARRAKRMLVDRVDIHPDAITEKTRIILDHFTSRTAGRMAEKARGMLVTRSRLHCVKYKLEFDKQMAALGLSYQAIVGFSGKLIDEDTGREYTEAGMNEFPESETEQRLKYPKYRILIVNNKFQTGFDEPLLHTMYVDKKLAGLQGVQTLSRLNRTMSGKTDTFVLDFVNKPEDIQESFQPYYQGTILTGATDPNHLYTIQQKIERHGLYGDEIVGKFVADFFDRNIPGEKLQGILDRVVHAWCKLDRGDQDDFRGHVLSFIRLYGYIVQIADFKDAELEELYIFLRHVVKKLPGRQLDDILDVASSVDLDYFRIEKKHEAAIELEEKDGDIDPPGGNAIGLPPEEMKDLLSDIIKEINARYGVDVTTENRAKLEVLHRRIQENEDLREVYEGDNSDNGIRHIFDQVYEKEKLNLVRDDVDFYNKINDPHVSQYINNRLYEGFQPQVD